MLRAPIRTDPTVRHATAPLRAFLIVLTLTLGACQNPAAPFHDPCDQGLFFQEPEVSISPGETVTMFVWHGARAIDFMGGGQACGRTSVQASWSSSDTRVVTVRASERPYSLEEEVEIRGIVPGRAEITARVGGRSATLLVTVVAP